MIRFALAVGAAMTAGGRAGDLLRRAVVPRLHLIPGVRAKIVDSTTPALHRSELVGKGGRRQLAGRLCPNAVLPHTFLPKGTRLDDEVGRRFAVISADSLDEAHRAEIGRRGASLIEADPDTELARWLQSGRARVAVVRPDRTVLAAGHSAASIVGSLPVFAPRGAEATA